MDGRVLDAFTSISFPHGLHNAAGTGDTYALVQLLHHALNEIVRLQHGVGIQHKFDISIRRSRLLLDGGRFAYGVLAP